MSRSMRLAGVSLTLLAALVAALIAHLAIDLAGDVFLRHDTYDDVVHRTRAPLFASIALLLALAFFRRAVALVQRSADDGRDTVAAALARISALRFVAFVSVTTVVAVGCFEAADVACAGQHVDDLGDLFGGSVLFGVPIALAAGVLAAFGVRAFARLLDALPLALARALVVRLAARLFGCQLRRLFTAPRAVCGVRVAPRSAPRAPPFPALRSLVLVLR